MDLRNVLAGLLSTTVFTPSKHHPEDMLPMADNILALVREHEGEQPSGLVAVKECGKSWSEWKNTNGGGVIPVENPPYTPHPLVCDCHGSGRIVRPLSIKEALEIPLMVMDGRAIVMLGGLGRTITLPSSEWVEVGK
jgi:hypothetical protein